MGVIPVPPATMPMDRFMFRSYLKWPCGPRNLSLSPTFILSMCCVMAPFGYTLITRSKWPTTSCPEVGVDARRATSSPSASSARILRCCDSPLERMKRHALRLESGAC